MNQIIFRLLILLFISETMLTGCKPKDDDLIVGYIEGKYTYIVANAPGNLNALYVNKGQTVKANQKIFELDKYPEEYDLTIAESRYKQAIENKKKLEADSMLKKFLLDQKNHLLTKKVISKDDLVTSQTEYDNSITIIKAEEENIKALQATVAKLEWMINQKTVSSPIDGLVVDVYYNLGELVIIGIPVVSLIDLNQQRIIFYIPEPLLSKIKIHQPIEVYCDNCTKPIKGEVTYISPSSEFTPPIIYNESMRGKLVYRIEGQSLGNEALYIHPGQPVTIKIH